jgi:MtrB/PioB family decaheme-associated outer membrane protein
MSKKTNNQFKLLPIAAAIMLAFGNAYAEEVQELITPDKSVSVGVGASNGGKDAMRFSQYTGLNQSASLLLDFEINKRDDETGTWMMFNGRNLGLDTRELSYSRSKQGDWKYVLDYNEIVRRDPYIINTGMTGVGSTTPTINLIANPTVPASVVNASGVSWAAPKTTANGANVAASPNGYAPSNGVAGSDVELKLNRTAIGLSGEKWFTPEIQFEVSFKNETKKGARLFGRAGLDSSDMSLRPNNSVTVLSPSGGWAVLLTPEPINSVTRQLEAKLNFNRDKLALTGGYYGSFYINDNGSLNPVVPSALNRGSLWTNCATAGCSTVQQIASSAVALPPDNQAHQVYVSGNYAFTDTTKSTFKASYTHATQNESFTGMGLTPATGAPASLGGVVDTTLMHLGLTMRPMQDLSVNGSFRYEDRADKTPIAVYNTNGITGNALNNTTNWPSGSQNRMGMKLDGIYRLANGYSVMLGGDWERKKSALPPSNTALFAAQVLFRPVLNEYGVHAEVRKSLSETANGALGMEFKQRRGNDTDWVTTNGVATATPATSNILVAFDPNAAVACTLAGATWTCANTAANRVLPIMYMDRDRTKVRGNLDWEATEQLSLQTVVEHTQDNYLRAFPTLISGTGASQAAATAAMVATQDIATIPGARVIIGDSLSLDSSYIVSEDWRLNVFGSRSFNRWNVNKASLGDDTRNTADTAGLALNGMLSSSLTVGVELLMTRDTTTFKNVVVNNPATAGALTGTGNILGFNGTATPGGNYLPTIHYSTNKLNVHGKYNLDKVSDVKVVLVAQQFKTDDWQWGYNGVPFVYSDNTTVSQPTNQLVKFAGASYTLKF